MEDENDRPDDMKVFERYQVQTETNLKEVKMITVSIFFSPSHSVFSNYLCINLAFTLNSYVGVWRVTQALSKKTLQVQLIG